MRETRPENLTTTQFIKEKLAKNLNMTPRWLTLSNPFTKVTHNRQSPVHVIVAELITRSSDKKLQLNINQDPNMPPQPP